jgi:hypothetical protein
MCCAFLFCRNKIFFNRLKATIELGYDEMARIEGPRVFGNKTVEDYINRVRFVHYGDHYLQALLASTLILDTFPYGGTIDTRYIFVRFDNVIM